MHCTGARCSHRRVTALLRGINRPRNAWRAAFSKGTPDPAELTRTGAAVPQRNYSIATMKVPQARGVAGNRSIPVWATQVVLCLAMLALPTSCFRRLCYCSQHHHGTIAGVTTELTVRGRSGREYHPKHHQHPAASTSSSVSQFPIDFRRPHSGTAPYLLFQSRSVPSGSSRSVCVSRS